MARRRTQAHARARHGQSRDATQGGKRAQLFALAGPRKGVPSAPERLHHDEARTDGRATSSVEDVMGFVAEFGKLGRGFALLWAGETAYGLAAGLMRFALGVWVYQQSGSAQQFAYVFLAATLPSLLLMPWA